MRHPIERLEHRRMLADVVGLALIDARTDQPVAGVDDLVDGAVIDLARVGRALNIRADLSGADPATSVRFNYDGDPLYALDNDPAFAIGGNTGGDFHPWTPTLGTHALVVTAYASPDGSGVRGASRTVLFQVIDSDAPQSIVRVNAGGGAYVATGGAAFEADAAGGAGAGFTGGDVAFTSYPVAGTADDPLYQARRFGKQFAFARGVDNGRYTLTLHFAEPTFRKPGQRVFDVAAEGELVLDDLDLVRDAGAKTALVKTFPVTVADGRIDVTFDASQNHAIVSAVELVPVPPDPITVPAPARVDAGGDGAIVDALGRAFEDDDGYFIGGADVAAPIVNYFNSNDDALLSSYRAGPAMQFARPVANGRYSLSLTFADPASQSAGERLFDVAVEGATVLDDFDVFAAADAARLLRGTYGAIDVTNLKMAITRAFEVNVTDGRLDIDFTGVFGNAIVSAITLAPLDIPPAIIPYSGLADYPNSPQREAVRGAWRAVSQSNLRQIGFALMMFVNEHKGELPPDLPALLEGGYPGEDLGVFANPRVFTLEPRAELSLLERQAWVAEQDDYLFNPAWAGQRYPRADHATTILVYENPDTTPYDDLNAVFADGHVEAVSRAALIAEFGGAAVAPPEPADRPMQTGTDPHVVAGFLNLAGLRQPLLNYANNNRGRLPLDLGLLYPFYVNDPNVFRNPRGATPPAPAGMTTDQTRAWINAQSDYVYLAAGRRFSAAPMLMYENPAEMPLGINILFNDGRVEFREMFWALETIAAAKAKMGV